jgi:hypothetical protein
MERKSFKAELLSFDDKALTLEHFISTETEDSGKDIMLADGMEKRGNVVVLFQHGLDPKFGNEPIAKVLDIRTGTNKKGAKGLVAKTQYFNGATLTPPDNTGERLYLKAKTGVMPNWSIGFESLIETPTAGGGRIVKKWLLHEYSQVAIGMNSEATTELGTEAPEVKFGVVFKREDEVENKTPVNPPAAKGSITSCACSAKVCHKSMLVLHRALIDDLKAAATAEGFSPIGSEKAAKEAMSEYSEAVSGHVGNYIKAMVGDDREPESGELAGLDEDDKSLAGIGHKIAHKALKMAHNGMIEDIRGCKGCKETNSEAKATELIQAHEKAALPHAVSFVKAWAEKCGKAALPLEHKTISAKTGNRICMDALLTIFNGMIWEATDRAFGDAEVNTEAICADVCSEAAFLFEPFLKWIIDDIKTWREANNTATVEAKDTAKKNLKNTLSKYLETKNLTAVPAVVTVSTSTDQGNKQPPATVKVFKPIPQTIKIKAAEEPPKIKIAIPEPKQEPISSIKVAPADIDKIAAMVAKNMKNVFNAELNRQKGKVE